MSATRRGLQKFQRWLDLLDEQGWKDDDKKFLVDFWWKHHDDNGDLYPAGKVREQFDISREHQK